MRKFKLTRAALITGALLFAPGRAGVYAGEQTRYNFIPPGKYTVIEEDEVRKILTTHGGRLLVVNYWATWCAPCVAEIPDFVTAAKKYRARDVQFVGFSLDFVKSAEQTVPPFLEKLQVPYPNYVLHVDPQQFIPSIAPEWSGALPATFLYNSKGEKIAQALNPLSGTELEKLIESNLNSVSAESESK